MSGLDHAAIDLLNRRFIGSLGTVDRDGSVHMVAIWYMLDGSRVLIPTGSGSRKTENLRRTAAATVMVDERNNHAMSGVVIRGQAYVLEGDEALGINRKIHRRYLSRDAMADSTVTGIFENDDVTLVVRCDSVVSWDMTSAIPEIFGDSGYMLPVDS